MQERIASFNVDHEKLESGLYVSRIDRYEAMSVTTFDLRMKKPNQGDYLSTGALHAIEHLGATFLRNDEEFKPLTVYFGPMGCRTGFYALFFGELDVRDVSEKIAELFAYIASFKGKIPGQSAKECGNYLDMSLEAAKKEAGEYLTILRSLNESNTIYRE